MPLVFMNDSGAEFRADGAGIVVAASVDNDDLIAPADALKAFAQVGFGILCDQDGGYPEGMVVSSHRDPVGRAARL